MSDRPMTLGRLKARHRFMCKWKKQFPTQELAEKMKKQYLARPNVQHPERLNTYKCLNGDHWHVGHMPVYPVGPLFRVVGRVG